MFREILKTDSLIGSKVLASMVNFDNVRSIDQDDGGRAIIVYPNGDREPIMNMYNDLRGINLAGEEASQGAINRSLWVTERSNRNGGLTVTDNLKEEV